jgi:hypothetical protein
MKYPLDKSILNFPQRKKFYITVFLVFGCFMLGVLNLGALVVGVACGVFGLFVGAKKHSVLDELLNKITPKDKQADIILVLEEKIKKLEKKLLDAALHEGLE